MSLNIPGLVNFRLCTLTDDELLSEIGQKLESLYCEGTIKRHIPARPNEDFDLLIGELMVRFYESKIPNPNLLP